jgi:hypothetical protein
MTRIVWFRRIGLAALITLAFGPVAAGQTGIGINFVAPANTNGLGNTVDITPLNPTDAAGVVPLTNWNNVNATSPLTTNNLINNSGMTTGVSVAVSGSTNAWASNPTTPATTPNGKMMQGYLDNTNTTTAVTVHLSGLNAAGFTGTYHVYVYAVGDTNSGGRNGDYTIGSQTFRCLDDTPFNGTFRLCNQAPSPGQQGQSGNYMDFTINGSDTVDISAIAAQDINGFRAPINGIQIVVPEPGSILCAAALGLGGIAAARRRFGRPPA